MAGKPQNPYCDRTMKLLVRWLLHAAALVSIASIYSGVEVQSYTSALLAALVIGLLNAFVRPILVLLTLPVTVLTMGLFLLVINAWMFWWASSMLEGFAVQGFGAALLGSLIYTLMGLVIHLSARALVLAAIAPPGEAGSARPPLRSGRHGPFRRAKSCAARSRLAADA